MKPFKLPRMSPEEVEALLDRERICRIAFKGEEFPYLAPFQYYRKDGALYFHFTDYGRKMRLLRDDSRVCVGVESFQPDMSEYRFVVLRGELERVADEAERAEAIRGLAEIGRSGLSENFLAAHGFPAEEGWGALTEEKPVVIVKLGKITDTLGLRSPG